MKLKHTSIWSDSIIPPDSLINAKVLAPPFASTSVSTIVVYPVWNGHVWRNSFQLSPSVLLNKSQPLPSPCPAAMLLAQLLSTAALFRLGLF